jgi:beta-mannosidase
MKTINSFTLPEDRNPFSYVMERHQKSVGGNGKILTYLSDTYKYPKDFSSLTYTSQLLQAEAIRYGVEHWRRNRGRCMGSIYWQLNDCWPTASWASIDYYGRWKALHYAAKRFYAPVLISVLDEDTKADIYVTNDTMQCISGTINWKLRNTKSDILESGSQKITIEKLMAKNFIQLDFSEKLRSNAKMSIYLDYDFVVDGNIVSNGTTFFVKPKYFMLEDPKILFNVTDNPDEFVLEIKSSSFAKAVELDLESIDLHFSDNYFDLSVGDVKKIIINKSALSSNITCDELKDQLKIFSLYDIEER